MTPMFSVRTYVDIYILKFSQPFAPRTPGKSIYFSIVFSYILRLLTILCFLAVPGYSTLIFFQWSAARIVLAADALVVLGRSGKFEGYRQACKIYQEGDMFIAMTGASQAGGLDFIS